MSVKRKESYWREKKGGEEDECLQKEEEWKLEKRGEEEKRKK